MLKSTIEKKENILQKIYCVFFIEKRLPISFEQSYHRFMYEKKLQNTLKKIANGKPIACTKNAKTELHMLTCERDMLMAITACKSFLRFYPGVSIVFHGDESLTNEMCDFITTAIPCSKLISYSSAERMLKSNKKVFKLRGKVRDRFQLPSGYDRQRKAWALKVFDFHMLSESNRIIVMDSDVLFTQRPDEIIDWVESEKRTAFYSIPQFPNLQVTRNEFCEIFPKSMPLSSFNGGLYGYDKSDLSSELLTDIVVKLISKTSYPILGDECFWRAVYSVIPASPLPFADYPLITGYYQKENLMPDLKKAKYIHFICKHRAGLYEKVARSSML
jgi:hypothetical protein